MEPTRVEVMAVIALIVGGIVRILKTKKMSDVIAMLPFSPKIPTKALPWIAVVLGVGISMLDAKLNGGIATWRSAFFIALSGVLAGGTAVGGHETVAKMLRPLGRASAPPSAPVDRETKTEPPPRNGVTRRLIGVLAAALTAVSLVLGTAACGSVMAILPAIIAIVTEAGQVIDAIASFCENYFKRHPDADAEAKVGEAVMRARSALMVLAHIANGAQDVDRKQLDKAFDDFKAAYLALVQLTQPYGVRMTKVQGLSAAPGILNVPDAESFRPRGK